MKNLKLNSTGWNSIRSMHWIDLIWTGWNSAGLGDSTDWSSIDLTGSIATDWIRSMHWIDLIGWSSTGSIATDWIRSTGWIRWTGLTDLSLMILATDSTRWNGLNGWNSNGWNSIG